MSEVFEIAVLGGGPAGMAAATVAAHHGAATVLLDEFATPGGQVYRQPASGGSDADRPGRVGDAMRASLAASGATVRSGTCVWGLGGGPLVPPGTQQGPFRIDYVTAGQAGSLDASALILCAGAHERVVPFPGWTLPGVIGLAAATIRLKAEAVLPGQRVVVAGTGPLLAAVAAGILRGGGTVAAVIDVRPRRDWVAALPALTARPDLLARGTAWLAAILRARVPVLSGWRVANALGDDAVRGIEAVPLHGGPARRFACDALCVGHGLVPATEAARLFRATHRFDAARGGWHPVLDAWQRTSVTRLYAAGDGAGIAGAAAAPAAGEIAALAALQDLARLPAADARAAAARPRHTLLAARRFGNAIAGLLAPPDALVHAIPADCTVCRCEDVTRAEIDTAIKTGARDLNQVKQFTRAGMGPCQGRMCGDTVAALLATAAGLPRSEIAGFTPRLPLRPVPMRALLGDFDYAEIPAPAAAPI